MKRGFSILLSIVVLFAAFSMTVFAEDSTARNSNAGNRVFVDETYTDSSGASLNKNYRFRDIDYSTYDGSVPDAVKRKLPKNGVAGKTEMKKVLGAAGSKAVSSYTYKITPLLPPFNEYFFVETDNPEPRSFRFADKSSKYDADSSVSVDEDDWEETIYIYADIKYDNRKTGRVNGGYIFFSGTTDGGNLTLQEADNTDPWETVWKDTKINVKLPALMDDADYLIDTYARQGSFFDNMDAVQEGFSSICLYSGSFIRGKLIKTDDYWSAAIGGHIDQSFYIYSPYDREGSRSLFASAIYPFRYDSLGFPSMMARISERLDSTSTYEWSSSHHAYVDVTYQGETRSYGGAGNGEGQGISEDKILKYYSFGDNGTDITLEDSRSLLDKYAGIEMDDDIPRDDALTWKQIYDTVGSGAWGCVYGGNFRTDGKWESAPCEFSYFYQDGDGTHFSADEWGIGYSNYWGGDLGYARDTWVDGRYVGEWRCFEPGEKFSDHPESDIILSDVKVPQVTYDWEYEYNKETSDYEYKYKIFDIREETKTVRFTHDNGLWKASYSTFGDEYADYDLLSKFAEKGLIDEKYLDAVTITQKEAQALGLDRNTNTAPGKGYIFDGTAQPGTPYDETEGHMWNGGEVVKKATYEKEGLRKYTCRICGEKRTETIAARVPKKGIEIKLSSGAKIIVTSIAKAEVAFAKAPNKKSVTVPAAVKLGGTRYKVSVINADAFKGKKIRTVTVGKNVKKIKAKAFRSSNTKKLIIKTKQLKKSAVKRSLTGSKVKTIKIKVGTKKTNRKYIKKYKGYFTKKNAGRKVTVQ